jgi:hypothetical protein
MYSRGTVVFFAEGTRYHSLKVHNKQTTVITLQEL